MDDLIWLTRWYASQCNGRWEHQNGIELDTLDNPGWMLRVNLEETDLETRRFKPQRNGTESEAYDPTRVVSWRPYAPRRKHQVSASLTRLSKKRRFRTKQKCVGPCWNSF
jgi:hypothetical protein